MDDEAHFILSGCVLQLFSLPLLDSLLLIHNFICVTSHSTGSNSNTKSVQSELRSYKM